MPPQTWKYSCDILTLAGSVMTVHEQCQRLVKAARPLTGAQALQQLLEGGGIEERGEGKYSTEVVLYLRIRQLKVPSNPLYKCSCSKMKQQLL